MTCVVVLGSHRTGSSALAGALHKMGINMGDKMYMEHPVSNPTGHYEDCEFLHLNGKAVGDWRHPQLELPDGYLDRYLGLIKAREEKNELWGIKDPRFCVTLRWIYPHIKNLKIICTHRNVEDAAKSLRRVHGLSMQDALRIQYLYEGARVHTLQEVVSNYENTTETCVYTDNYFDELMKNPNERLLHILKWLRLDNPDRLKKGVEHINPELRHYGTQK